MLKKYKLATRIISCLLIMCVLLSCVMTVSFTKEKTEKPVYILTKKTYSEEMPIYWRYTNQSGYEYTRQLSNTYYRGASVDTPENDAYVAYCMDWGVNGPNASGSIYDHPTDDVSATRINQLTYVLMNGYNGDGDDHYELKNVFGVDRYGRSEYLTDDGGLGTRTMQIATQIAIWLIMGEDSRGRVMTVDGWVRNENCQNLDCDIMEIALDLYENALRINESNLNWLGTDITNVQGGYYDERTDSKLYGPIQITSDFRDCTSEVKLDLSNAPAGTKVVYAGSLDEIDTMMVGQMFYVSVPNDAPTCDFEITMTREKGMVSPIAYEEENEERQRMFFSTLSSVSTEFSVKHTQSDSQITIRKTNYFNQATGEYEFVGNDEFVFDLYYYTDKNDTNPDYIGEFTTDANGYITISGLSKGFYNVYERLYPDQETKYITTYLRSDGTVIEEATDGVLGFEIATLGDDYQIHCHNKQGMTAIKIDKVDAFTYEPISGAQFAVVKVKLTANGFDYVLGANGKPIKWNGESGGNFQGSVFFDINGQKLPYLPIEPVYLPNGQLDPDANTYAIIEKAPTGYAPLESAIIWTLKEDQVGQIGYISVEKRPGQAFLTNRPLMNSLEIIKTDKETGAPIAGVQYNLYVDNGGQKEFVATLITDRNGIATYGLVNGAIDTTKPSALLYGKTYYLKEISAPAGYYVPDEYIQVPQVSSDVEKDLGKITVELTNEKISGSVTVNKTDSENNKLEGVEFEIYRVIDDALVSFGDYMYTQNIYDVVENAQYKYVTYITKDGSAVDLTGISEYLELVEKYTTDTIGQFNTELPYGDYVMIETKTVSGYKLLNALYNFSISENSASYYFECLNDPITGSVHLTKTNQKTGEFIEGVKFDLFMKGSSLEEPEIKIGTYTTNSKGELNIDGLKMGQYFFVEVSTPDRYKLPTAEESKAATSFQIARDGEVKLLNITNEEKELSVTVYKTDNETQKPINGTKFALMQGDTVCYEAVTNSDGIATFNEVAIGEYKLVEVQAATGYDIKSFEPTTVVVDGMEAQKVYVGNDKIRGDIKILKIDQDTQKPLEGVEFTLYSANDEQTALRTLKTDANGIVVFDKVVFGEYVVVETKTLEGYKLQETKTFVNIEDTKEYFHTIANELIKKTIKLTKVDKDTTTPIADVEFDVYAIVDGEKIKYASIKTDENGECNFVLPFGVYELVETKTGVGYRLTDEVTNLDMTVETLPDAIDVTITNELIKNKITLVKHGDEIGNLLSGATYGLYELTTDKLIAEGTTDENGEFCFGEIPYGSYYLKEITPPEGYTVSEDALKFTVDENSDAEQVINAVDHALPQTGVVTNTSLLAILMTLSAGLFVSLLVLEHKMRAYSAKR